MQHADYVHLVRLSEHASENDDARYRRSVALFATLGYAWAAGCYLLPAFALAWMAAEFLHGYLDFGLVLAVLAAAFLAWGCVRALWWRLDAPSMRLRPADAPGLFRALEGIRRKVKGPPLHEVVLDGELHAVITQRPRWGLFGGTRNRLTIGLPLLLALDRRRVLAVLAHEYGHLRGNHGHFTAWVYRTRARWSRLHAAWGRDRGPLAALTLGFLAWYSPRFVARTFALARQDEYEADRISARLLGGEVTAAALTEMVLKGDWLQQQFWPTHWALAADHAAPVGPYRHMLKLLPLPLPEAFAGRSLRQALRRSSGLDDTHPALRQRLEGLGMERRVLTWSVRPALELLGGKAQRLIAHFDAHWCAQNATGWKQHHSALGRIRTRVEQLQAQRHRSADEWTELGDLQRRLKHDAPVRHSYAQALAQAPRHGKALQGLYACLPAEQVQQRRACLERLHEASPQHRWWAAQAAVAALQDDPAADAQALELWRGRLTEAEAAEARAWGELAQQPFLQGVTRADLSDFERYELESELARWPDVQCAWLLRRPLREFPDRRAYLLVVDLPRLTREQALELCRAMEPGLWLPGPVLLLWSGQSPELETLRTRLRPLYDTRVLV